MARHFVIQSCLGKYSKGIVFRTIQASTFYMHAVPFGRSCSEVVAHIMSLGLNSRCHILLCYIADMTLVVPDIFCQGLTPADRRYPHRATWGGQGDLVSRLTRDITKVVIWA